MRLLCPDTYRYLIDLARQRIERDFGLAPLAVDLAQRTQTIADGQLGFTQFVRSVATLHLRLPEFLLQRLQTQLERIELGLLALGLIGTRDERASQQQREQQTPRIHPTRNAAATRRSFPAAAPTPSFSTTSG